MTCNYVMTTIFDHGIFAGGMFLGMAIGVLLVAGPIIVGAIIRKMKNDNN